MIPGRCSFVTRNRFCFCLLSRLLRWHGKPHRKGWRRDVKRSCRRAARARAAEGGDEPQIVEADRATMANGRPARRMYSAFAAPSSVSLLERQHAIAGE